MLKEATKNIHIIKEEREKVEHKYSINLEQIKNYKLCMNLVNLPIVCK